MSIFTQERRQLQNFRHLNLSFPQLQVVHFVFALLHLHVFTNWFKVIVLLSGLISVHLKDRVPLSATVQPQFVTSGGSSWDSVFPQMHPLWNVLRRTCISRAARDGGKCRRFFVVEVQYILNRTSFTEKSKGKP